jgi:hypothetical protein
MNPNKVDKILHELYRKAFKASTPSGDWDELYANAPLNEFNQKVIPFMDYECEQEVMEEILETTLKEYKVPKWRKRSFEITFWLGCSPKSKKLKTVEQ